EDRLLCLGPQGQPRRERERHSATVKRDELAAFHVEHAPIYRRANYLSVGVAGSYSVTRSSATVRVYLSLKSGFPNTDGMRSWRNKSNCALPPTDRPASLFSGTIASTATCQLTATYENPGFMVATVFCPRDESNENSTRGTSWFSGSSFGSLPGVKRLVR